VQTRFPPEPNGYLHIGHAKSICLNFGLARSYGGKCNLRFDDTNPTKEEQEYVDSIQADVRWLGFEWDALYYASDFFEQLYQFAEHLIRTGQAYVCDLTGEQISEYRGSLDKPGRPSPFRERPAAESLDLFRRMRQGEFPNGARTLRAKIDMASPNPNLRDPVLYRILHAHHHRTGDRWCIYPMYDFAPRPVRRAGGHHALDLHAGVRDPPSALQLVPRAPAGRAPPAADRVRAPEPDLHRAQQAQAARAGAGAARERLGRSAHAHALGHPPARLHARGPAALLRPDRRGALQQHGRQGRARERHPRRPEPARAARHGRCSIRFASRSRTSRPVRSSGSSA
jgi:hypothetical protein